MNTKDLNSYKVILGQDQKHEVLSLNLTKWLADIRTSIIVIENKKSKEIFYIC